MRVPPTILDEIRARLPVSQVVGRHVKLRRQGREYIGLSPFKQEKTPSFTVNDQKGFYHCFASGHHGDIFRFLTEVEGLNFREAVEQLAQEAGVALPAPSPEAEQEEQAFDRLRRLMETAASFFEDCLRSSQGAAARRYLDERGLNEMQRRTFRIGYGPDSYDALRSHLTNEGFTENDMERTGMRIAGPDIKRPYDRFRNRIMFPITDLKGRVIAFGGRALSPDQPAKYLNSPETPLFHKSQILFNAPTARKSAYDLDEIIAVEGYMDVIAMAGAGIGNVVAPLGTALTSEQLAMMWRMAPEPTLCFDGDVAGQKAAIRAIDVALSRLQPGFSLKFAFLPDGKDPDDLLKASGPDALRKVLKGARPLVDVLWESELGAGNWNTPERRAALESQLGKRLAPISDPTVKRYYEREIRDRLWKLWRPQPGAKRFQPQSGAKTWQKKTEGTLAAARHQINSAPGAASGMRAMLQRDTMNVSPREAAILLVLKNHPWLMDEHIEDVAELRLGSPASKRLRDEMLTVFTDTAGLADIAPPDTNQISEDGAIVADYFDRTLKTRGQEATLRLLEKAVFGQEFRLLNPAAPRENVLAFWRQITRLHNRVHRLNEELAAAEKAVFEETTEGNLQQLREIRKQIDSCNRLSASLDDMAE